MTRPRLVRVLVAIALLVMAALMLLAASGPLHGCARARAPQDDDGSMDVAALLGGTSMEDFARALEPRSFEFPRDHGPHDGFRTEWWYYTGNLTSREGRRFGFQLTFFRNALSPERGERDSKWATNVVHMGHFALSDIDGERFFSFERLEREALDLAGATADPFRVWIDDWQTQLAAPGDESQTSAAARARLESGHLPMHVRAAEDGVSLELTLVPEKPLVLQGDRGLSQKGSEPGNASYYYSFTRLRADGRSVIEGVEHELEGLAWMDREWSTSALGPGQVGWDWFALQLDDGTELMYYRLRRDDGSTDPLSAGTFVPASTPDAPGRPGSLASRLGTARRPALPATRLGADDVVLSETATWESPLGGRYPAGWTLEVDDLDLALDVTPLLPDQELDVTVRYWEGAVSVRGTRGGRPVQGRGYVELTGYAE